MTIFLDAQHVRRERKRDWTPCESPKRRLIGIVWYPVLTATDPHVGTTQTASLRMLVGIARRPLEATGEIGLKAELHIWLKLCIFNMYSFGNAFLIKHNAQRFWSRVNETWVSTCTECPFWFQRSGDRNIFRYRIAKNSRLTVIRIIQPYFLLSGLQHRLYFTQLSLQGCI